MKVNHRVALQSKSENFHVLHLNILSKIVAVGGNDADLMQINLMIQAVSKVQMSSQTNKKKTNLITTSKCMLVYKRAACSKKKLRCNLRQRWILKVRVRQRRSSKQCTETRQAESWPWKKSWSRIKTAFKKLTKKLWPLGLLALNKSKTKETCVKLLKKLSQENSAKVH